MAIFTFLVLSLILKGKAEFQIFVFGEVAPSGPGPPHSRGFLITHNDTLLSVGLLWTSDQLVAETST